VGIESLSTKRRVEMKRNPLLIIAFLLFSGIVKAGAPDLQVFVDESRLLAVKNLKIDVQEEKTVLTFDAENKSDYWVMEYEGAWAVGNANLDIVYDGYMHHSVVIGPRAVEKGITVTVSRKIENSQSFAIALQPKLAETLEFLEFTAAAFQQGQNIPCVGGCSDASGEACDKRAEARCGDGNIKKVDCTIERCKCICNYECFDKRKTPTTPNQLSMEFGRYMFPWNPYEEMFSGRNSLINPWKRTLPLPMERGDFF
jgi:hypothetical protein